MGDAMRKVAKRAGQPTISGAAEKSKGQAALERLMRERPDMRRLMQLRGKFLARLESRIDELADEAVDLALGRTQGSTAYVNARQRMLTSILDKILVSVSERPSGVVDGGGGAKTVVFNLKNVPEPRSITVETAAQVVQDAVLVAEKAVGE